MYTVGDIVRLVNTYWYGDLKESREDIGKLFVIDEVNGHSGCRCYSIRNLDTGGGSSWWSDDHFEYVGKADPDIFNRLDKIRNELKERNRDINYIKENFSIKLPTTSWLYLFDKIGYDTSFNRNGEYWILANDIMTLYPVFDCLFKQDIQGAFKKIEEVFKTGYIEKYKVRVQKFYDEYIK